MQDFWFRQELDRPLFPDILWSRPESKQTSGKLLIIGGNLHSFIAAQQAYQAAVVAGAGTVRIILPEALRRIVGKTLENCSFAASNISGSFARLSLDELLVQAEWADCVLLPGDLGRNSETAVVLETFVEKYKGQLVLTKDTIDYFSSVPKLILDRPNTCIVGSTAQLQKLATGAHSTEAIGTHLDLVPLVKVMHNFSEGHKAHFVTQHLGTTIVVAENKVSTTKTATNEDIWRIPTATKISVFWMQNLTKPFEALTSSLVSYK